MQGSDHEVQELKCPINYSNLYKYNGLLDNQLDRRNKLLLELRKRRHDQIDELRGIADVFEDSTGIEEPVDAIQHRKKRQHNYGHRLMLSEWMTEVPSDLEDNWVFKICPVGVRNIIVASNGVTKAYNRKNKVKAVFQSKLPGGSQVNKFHSFTLLDCIYRDKEKTYYVLDLLVWNSCSLIKCSSEFRFFFLKSKLLEDPDLSSNKFSFTNIDCYPATLNTIEASLINEYTVNDKEIPVDGILFYHKFCTYMTGLTPLVGWLKPYMIPEKLCVPVNEFYMKKKPKDYINLEFYLESVRIKYKKGNENKYSEETDINNMETDPCQESSNEDMLN